MPPSTPSTPTPRDRASGRGVVWRARPEVENGPEGAPPHRRSEDTGMPSRGDRVNSKTGIRDEHPFVYPSRDEAQRYRRELQDAVDAMRERRFPQRGALVWPAGLDRRHHRGGTALPEGRHNLLRHAGLMEGDNPLTAHEVLCMPYISSRAIREILFAVDEFLSEYVKSFEGRPEPAASVVAMRLRMEVEKLTPREVLIVEHRVLSRPRKTLKEIAAQVGSVVRAHPADSNQNGTKNQDGVRT